MDNHVYKTEDVKKVSDSIRNHKATVTANTISRVKISFYIFEANYKETYKWLTALENQNFVNTLNPNVDSEKLNSFMDETARHLHNYLASAKTLIDHTRHMSDDLYKNTSFYVRYNQRIEEVFTSNALRIFIQDLRNYNLHNYIPILLAKFSINEQGAKLVEIGLDTKTLLEWEGWTKGAKQYISNFEKFMPLTSFMSEYFIVIKEFYEWLQVQQEKLHKDDFDELMQIVKRYNLMLKEINKWES